jgi:hypothetical protein
LSGRLSLGGALFLALLAASLAAAVLVVRARDPDLALEVTERSCEPAPCPDRTVTQTFSFDPAHQTARITFFVRYDDPQAFVGIVGADDEPVRTLDSQVELEEGREVRYSWDGRDDAGSLVAPESYYLRVELPDQDRTMVWPKRIKVLPPTDSDAQGAG